MTNPKKNSSIALGSILLLGLVIALSAATGTIMPSPVQTVLDSNGNPVASACVWTYTAGTSTPVATYSDVGLTTPNANPIIANSAGRFTAYLSPGSSYKFVYENTPCSSILHGSTILTADNIAAFPSTANPTTTLDTVNLRLTLTSGTPVTTADVTAATTVYIEPYKGNRIALYDGTTWNLRTVTASSFAVPASTSQMYDVFSYDNATTPTYETLAWTNDTTRATALTTQDGVLVKSGAVTRRYLGSFRTTTVSGQTEDSGVKRYLWNYYNRVDRQLLRNETASSWTYTLTTPRQANANTANQVDIVVGVAEVLLEVMVGADYENNSGVNAFAAIGVGEDSTSTFSNSGTFPLTKNAAIVDSQPTAIYSFLRKYPAVGRHFYAWIEAADGTHQITYGGNWGAASTYGTSGISGRYQG